MYQLWMYFEEGAHTSSSHDDISSHQKITEGDLYSLDLIKKDYEKKALREFLTNNDRNANCREFYIREHGEPTY
jgi:hypothetical protein